MRNGTKAVQACMVLIFAGLLLLPLFTFRFTGAEKNDTEKRVLEDFPSFHDFRRRIADREIQKETENWMNDHIGFRDSSRDLYFRMIHGVLKLSTSGAVIFGLEDWLFYTMNENLSIARGAYPLTDERIKTILDRQEQIQGEYSERGIQYHLLLTPSKVSIYSEYLPFHDVNLQHLPADQIEHAMKENGAEYVINTGHFLAEQKAASGNIRLFFKTDTHWNARGSYYAYACTIRRIKEGETAIEVSFSDTGSRQGDLNQMLGLTGREFCETAPVPEYEWHSVQQKPDQELSGIVRRQHEKQGSAYSEPLVYYNKEKAGSGTLVIYGDSMMGEWLYFPRYMAEHFEKVVVLRLRCPEPETEEYLKTTHVLFQTTERFIVPALL